MKNTITLTILLVALIPLMFFAAKHDTQKLSELKEAKEKAQMETHKKWFEDNITVTSKTIKYLTKKVLAKQRQGFVTSGWAQYICDFDGKKYDCFYRQSMKREGGIK